MQEREVTIINKLGLHARAAAKLVACAQGFASRITVEKAGNEVDAKSIMSVMLLAAAQGTVLTLRADGEDEEDAVEAIQALIDDYFGEGE